VEGWATAAGPGTLYQVNKVVAGAAPEVQVHKAAWHPRVAPEVQDFQLIFLERP
jgi:hypothetical protein